jgi:serine/threonine protein kinase
LYHMFLSPSFKSPPASRKVREREKQTITSIYLTWWFNKTIVEFLSLLLPPSLCASFYRDLIISHHCTRIRNNNCLDHSYFGFVNCSWQKQPLKTPKSSSRRHHVPATAAPQQQQEEEEDCRILGTPDYLAPELILRQKHGQSVHLIHSSVIYFFFNIFGRPAGNEAKFCTCFLLEKNCRIVGDQFWYVLCINQYFSKFDQNIGENVQILVSSARSPRKIIVEILYASIIFDQSRRD